MGGVTCQPFKKSRNRWMGTINVLKGSVHFYFCLASSPQTTALTTVAIVLLFYLDAGFHSVRAETIRINFSKLARKLTFITLTSYELVWLLGPSTVLKKLTKVW